MPAALDALITAGFNDGGTAFSYLMQARNHLYDLGNQIAANNWAAAETACDQAADDFGQFGKYLMQDDIWYHGLRYDWKEAFQWISDNWPVGGGVTMADILSEMLSASFEELTSFMGITQAYKVAVWDAPFNEEFYAALARGFKTWGA